MKRTIISVFVVLSFVIQAQQTAMYTQYTFNKAGMNPAASGNEINQPYHITFGTNQQWLGFDNPPSQNFFNYSYTIRPPRSYKHWQNVGLYIDSDKSGLIGYSSVYAGYAFHLLLRKSVTLSFGVYAGVRQFVSATAALDPNDPAVYRNKNSLILYPDIIPGFRLGTKKSFLDLSVRQITINKLKDFKGRKIGKPSKLYPTIYFDYGRKFHISDYFLMMPSVAVNLPLIAPPSIDGTMMFYFANRIGAGLGIRNLSFASAIVQVRVFQNLTVGLAYSYPISKLRYTNQNSFELMVGMIPIGMDAKLTGKHSVAKCPGLSY